MAAAGVDTTPLPFGAGTVGQPDYDYTPPTVLGSSPVKASPITSAVTAGTAFPTIGNAASPGNRQYARTIPGTERRAPSRADPNSPRDVRLDFNFPVYGRATRFDPRELRALEAQRAREAQAAEQYAYEQAGRDYRYRASPGRVAVDEAMFQKIARERVLAELLAEQERQALPQTGSLEQPINPLD